MSDTSNPPSIRDIAEIAGVSVATVSRVLNKKGKYSATTEKRVLAVVNSCGYISNMSAKSLREARSHTVGLIVPNVTNAFFSQLAYSIETELFQRNYSVFICNSGTDADKERDYFRTLIGKCVDGILCISDLNEIPSDILDRGVPIVCIDRRPVVDRAVPWVGNDDRAAAFNATELLIRKGCRHILFISSHHSAYTRFDRDKGYRQALEAHGIPADENYSMRRPGIDPTPIETEVMVYDFVQKGLPLDGIIASSEPAALGTLYALKRAGLRVPQDVKIVSFDSTLYSLLTDPPPAKQKPEEQGRGKGTPSLDLAPLQMLRTKQYWLCAGAVCCSTPAVLLFSPIILKLGMERGLDEGAALWSVVLGSVGSAAGRLLMPLLSDRIGRRPTDLILFGVSLGLSAAFLFAQGWLVVAVYAGLTFCYSALAAVLPSLSTDLFGLPHAGVNYGFLALGQSVGSLAFPFAANLWGLATGRHWLAMAGAAAGFVCIWALRPVRAQQPPRKN